jgi:hypothetical protein
MGRKFRTKYHQIAAQNMMNPRRIKESNPAKAARTNTSRPGHSSQR